MISLRRGVNISHWLSQSGRRGAERRAWTTRDDFARIRSMGFDHVRIPLDEEQLWDADGRKEPDAWDLLEHALDWAEAEDLRVSCDLHILRSHHFNQETVPALYTDPAALERFLDLWRDLAPVLASRSPDRVVLEILNEAVARDPADWNRVSGAAFRAIRELAPRHDIVLGSNWYCMCGTYGDLEIPDDPGQILTFHFYDPMCVTHYNASWTPLGPWEGGVSYPGLPWPDGVPDSVPEPLRGRMAQANVPWGPDRMEEQLRQPLARAREKGLRLWCGEFGVHVPAPPQVRAAWIGDAVRVFERNGIGWCLWDWKGVFGAVDAEGRSRGLEKALFGG